MAEALMGEDRWRSLLPFAKGEENELLEALLEYGNVDAGAEALGLDPNIVRGRLSSIEYHAARRGWEPSNPLPNEVQAGFHVKRLSQFFSTTDRETGEPTEEHLRNRWVITEPDKAHRVAALIDAVRNGCEPIKGLADPVDAPANADGTSMCVYLIGDLHLGMHAWMEETGESYDLKTCEAMIVDSMKRLIARSPRSKRAVILNAGDWFHSDSPDNRTRRSGHALDVDTRWGKVYQVGIKIQRALGALALAHHDSVELINLIGNHDDMSAVTLSHAMSLYWEREPRMEVDLSPAQHRFREHGACLLGFHHGHETKQPKLAGVMQTDQREAWGRVKFCHWYCGHIHHKLAFREDPGVVIEYLRSPSPRDAWASGQGFRSDRDLRCDVWDAVEGLTTQIIQRALVRQ